MPDPRADGPAADPLAAAILEALASEPPGAGMSLPRLGKRLGLGASVLMRCLATLGDARLGEVQGPGWVVLAQDGGRWVATLTERGRAAWR